MSKLNRIFSFFAVGLGISVIIAYWLQQQEQFAQQQKTLQPTTAAPEPPEETHIVLSTQALDAATPTDDLTTIGGIGPKTAEALLAIGINSFAALAAASAEELAERLQSLRGINVEKVTGWIEQAKVQKA